jgi:hypothetical protein
MMCIYICRILLKYYKSGKWRFCMYIYMCVYFKFFGWDIIYIYVYIYIGRILLQKVVKLLFYLFWGLVIYVYVYVSHMFVQVYNEKYVGWIFMSLSPLSTGIIACFTLWLRMLRRHTSQELLDFRNGIFQWHRNREKGHVRTSSVGRDLCHGQSMVYGCIMMCCIYIYIDYGQPTSMWNGHWWWHGHPAHDRCIIYTI